MSSVDISLVPKSTGGISFWREVVGIMPVPNLVIIVYARRDLSSVLNMDDLVKVDIQKWVTDQDNQNHLVNLLEKDSHVGGKDAGVTFGIL